jgi:ubiquinone/menaquinone biosynthesis C-methylase UbiE
MERQTLSTLASSAFTIAAILVVTQQCRKPTSLPGRLFVWIMNRSHREVTRWGFERVVIGEESTILDVGCGGGKTIQMLAGLATRGTVYGVDYSRQSVAASRRLNAQGIRDGRVDILQGSVSRLPFPDATFDVVSAIETHYYWPSPVDDMREVRRVLKPGGRFLLIAETYKGRSFDFVYRPAMKLLRATYLTVEEHRALLSSAGFAEVSVSERRDKGWLAAVGTRRT